MAFLASRIEKELVAEPKPLIDLAGVPFGSVFTDHMFVAHCEREEWTSLKIAPRQNLNLPPHASVFQDATVAFEGMKAFRDSAGQIRLFRSLANWERFLCSCQRRDGLNVDPVEADKCLRELLRVESRWVPSARGFSLYIRPSLIGASAALGSNDSGHMIFFIILSPVGPYYATGFKPVPLWACTEYARAWYGSIGCYKAGANYAITVMPGEIAHDKGCQQVLWLSGPERYITEVGSMNLLARGRADTPGRNVRLHRRARTPGRRIEGQRGKMDNGRAHRHTQGEESRQGVRKRNGGGRVTSR
jgi:branched-chain amino acid aminotransferase